MRCGRTRRRLQDGHVAVARRLLLLGTRCTRTRCRPRPPPTSGRGATSSEPPGEEIADFEEYTRLYRESWSDPDIRWLLSTVPSTMIFDDHDVQRRLEHLLVWVAGDASAAVVGGADHRRVHVVLALPAPRQPLAARAARRRRCSRLVQADDDAGPRLREFAREWDRESAASRWAYYRDFGRSRLLVIDSRAARVLAEGRPRDDRRGGVGMDREHARGSFDHLIIASTLPVFMAARHPPPRGVERGRVRGAWGTRPGRIGARVATGSRPRALAGVSRLVRATRRPAADDRQRARRGRPARRRSSCSAATCTRRTSPRSISAGDAGRSRVYQIVCSPFRNPAHTCRSAGSSAGRARALPSSCSRRLARLCNVAPSTAQLALRAGPTFENSIGELELDERTARVTISCSASDSDGGPLLRRLHTRELSSD